MFVYYVLRGFKILQSIAVFKLMDFQSNYIRHIDTYFLQTKQSTHSTF